MLIAPVDGGVVDGAAGLGHDPAMDADLPRSFDLAVSHSQVIIHLPTVERPGHRWEEDHLRQGFAWSEGLVSLAVPEHAEICRVRVEIVEEHAVPADCLSCVRVPFEVTAGPLSIGSVFEAEEVEIPLDRYALIFTVRPGEGRWTLELDGETESGEYSDLLEVTLIPTADPSFAILRAGGGVQVDRVLREDAETA
ncbi:hypothetical protein BKE38_26970 [Pseudoroseomonas deserti]|uniref:Uncharacterized protein n=2 Tax=Teichococcus deserti TaxID=1817963 RepID=A0A1V2GWF6_9PROT|nr:hypothetical protein BKE38_26970 [Pseudoroseomonas deserti]